MKTAVNSHIKKLNETQVRHKEKLKIIKVLKTGDKWKILKRSLRKRLQDLQKNEC
jgi:hypothetical protein